VRRSCRLSFGRESRRFASRRRCQCWPRRWIR
jgi:hypothetical protein